jgi:hypothetical protein
VKNSLKEEPKQSVDAPKESANGNLHTSKKYKKEEACKLHLCVPGMEEQGVPHTPCHLCVGKK